MPTPASRSNRGPAAAAENRRALIVAARRLFAERGYRVPLSAVARAAGLGQGVLYRHFPTRFDLAIAVFEVNLAELDALADDDPRAFARLWDRLVELTIREAAFVEMMVDAHTAAPAYDGEERLRGLVGRTLPAARKAGLVPDDLDVETVLLAWRMAYGLVTTAPDAARARADVTRTLANPWPRGATGRG
jgi:AcrR family transcriptional regulator